MEIYEYDLEKFNFPAILRDLLEVDDLTKLRTGLPDDEVRHKNSIYKNMERTELYQRLYENLAKRGGDFFATYKSFISKIVQPIFGEDIYFQAKPSLRIHFIDSIGQLRFHKDSDYGHREEEVNFTVPMTPVWGSNSFYLESAPGKEDFEPMEMKPGQFARFKGSTHTHGARENLTDSSRVSFDFRVVPASQAPDSLKKEAEKQTQNQSDLKAQLSQNPHTFVLLN